MDVGGLRVSIPRLVAILAVIAIAGIQAGALTALAIFGSLLIFWGVSLWPRWVRENALLLAVVAYVGVFIGLDRTEAELDFYIAAAQIIPVLFLAMTVGSRLLSVADREEIDRRVRIVLIYAFAIGEWYSLDAIASGSPSDSAFAFVVAALVAAGIVIIAEVVGRESSTG